MITPVDPATLPAPVQRILTGPPKMQEMAAKGVAIGILPGDLVLLLLALTQQAEPAIADQANRTLGNLPAQVLQGALGAPLAPAAIHALATRYHSQTSVLERLVGLPQIDIDTIIEVAKLAGELTCELIATNAERMLANTAIIEELYVNTHCRMSTADRIIELAVRNGVEVNLPAWREAAAAIQNELIPERTGEASPDDHLFAHNLSVAESMRQDGDEIEDAVEEDDEEGKVKEKYVPLYREIAMMTNSQKIRFASIGTPEAILLLVADPSPLVSLAAAK